MTESLFLSGLFWLSISCLAIVSASIINMAMSNRLFCPVIAAVRLPVEPHLVVVVAAAFYCALCIVHYYSVSYCSSASASAFPCLPQLESMSTSISLVSTNYKCIMYYDRSPAAHAKLDATLCSFLAPLTFNYPWLAISQVTDFVTNCRRRRLSRSRSRHTTRILKKSRRHGCDQK